MTAAAKAHLVDPDVQPDIKGVVAYLSLGDPRAAIAFYEKAFDARLVHLLPAEDGERVMHACVAINEGWLMFASAFPEHGYPLQPPQGYILHIQADDPQAWWDRAVAAGCEVAMPMGVQFWGDRYGQLKDPFGVTWSIGGPAD